MGTRCPGVRCKPAIAPRMPLDVTAATPKHGSWLNMAESELAILSNQCLDRRIPDRRGLKRQVDAWLLDRKHSQCQS